MMVKWEQRRGLVPFSQISEGIPRLFGAVPYSLPEKVKDFEFHVS
jgi:hypothetical protein